MPIFKIMYLTLSFLNRIYKTGFLLVVVLLLADLLTFFFYPKTIFGDIFLATREQTPLTWISSLAMFFLALSCFSVHFKTKKKIWYFLSAVFLFFSIDDATYLHERISGFLSDQIGFFSFFPSYAWIIIYFPFLIFSLGSLIYLVWKDALGNNRKKIIWALLVLGFAIFLDLLDGFVQKNAETVFCLDHYCNLVFTHLTRLTEEILEVIALGILGYVNIKEHCIIDEKR